MKVLVVGAGKTGLSVARFYRERGDDVVINDIKNEGDFSQEEMEEIKKVAEFRGGGHPEELFRWAERIVVSPGISPSVLPLFKEEREKFKGDVEDAFRWIDGRIIGVTGTKGKTSFCMLLSEVLSAAGFRVFAGGNIGIPYIEARKEDYDWLVLELSSFQLEWIEEFRPRVGILLNLKPDHLDRYANMEEYLYAKMKLFANQREGDTAILSADIPLLKNFKSRAEILWFSREGKVEKGVWKEGERVFAVISAKKDFTFDRKILRKVLSWENLLAYIAFCESLSIEEKLYLDVLMRFSPPPHRLELVAEWNGIEFYNDSKSTTPFSVMNAIEIIPPPLILIMGGRNKNLSFVELRERMPGMVKAVVLFGESRWKIREDIEGSGVPVYVVDGLEEAVKEALKNAEKGDRVVFSPGCASFDMFKNYAERGKKFVEVLKEYLR